MPNFNELDVQSVEFDAPLSSGSAAAERKHFSIDLTLELERQLDTETYPPTPSPYTTTHANPQGAPEASNRESLDPHVLARIIKQLQQSLAEVTHDRDELRQLIASTYANEAELQEALQHMIDKATTMEVELSDARTKMKDNEEAITMLRSKVEESRRALMRLQTEGRRQSQIPSPLDLSRAGLPLLGISNLPSSKRSSFAPLTGNPAMRPSHGHRRISSVSDSSPFTSPNIKHLEFPDSGSHSSPNSSRNYSGLFSQTLSPPSQFNPDLPSPELEALRKELRAVKDELDNTKHELEESNEAREASEMCVKALRTFIGDNSIGSTPASGMTSGKLPPPPIMATGDEGEGARTASVSSWGFRLWKDTPIRSPLIPQPATVASPVLAPSPQIPTSAMPLSRKLGGFFSSRNSISSVASSGSSGPPTATPLLQSNAAMNIKDEVCSVSDTSSVVEPISPLNEVDTNIVVKDVTNISIVGDRPLQMKNEMHAHAPSDPDIVGS